MYIQSSRNSGMLLINTHLLFVVVVSQFGALVRGPDRAV